MSAYVVNDATINAIVTYAASIDARYYQQGVIRTVMGDEQRIAGLLYTANVESVNCRYGEDDPSDPFTFRPVPASRISTDAKQVPLFVLSLCNCLEYQSCELPQWETTLAKAILTGIREAVIRQLPGIDKAPWGLRD